MLTRLSVAAALWAAPLAAHILLRPDPVSAAWLSVPDQTKTLMRSGYDFEPAQPRRRGIAAICLLLGAVPSALRQSQLDVILGMITDATGGTIPGAKLAATNVETQSNVTRAEPAFRCKR